MRVSSMRASASSMPSAEKLPGSGGTMTRGILSSRARLIAVQRAAAAEDEQREIAQIVAALDRDLLDRGRHLRVGEVGSRSPPIASASAPA